MTRRVLVSSLTLASLLFSAPLVAEKGEASPDADPPSGERQSSAILEERLSSELDGEVTFLWLVGELALRNGRWNEALEAYARAAEHAPTPLVFDRWAQAALLAGNAPEFDRVLTLWRAIAPQSERLQELSAHRDRLTARFEAQIGAKIAEILANHPNEREETLLGLPAALAELGNPEQILRLITAAVEPYRSEPAAHLIVSEAARQAGALAEAERAVVEALRLRPDWPPALAQWAQVALDQMTPERAIPTLEAALARHPDNLTVALALAALLAESDATPSARPLQLLAPWVKKSPPEPRVIAAIAAFGAQGVAPEEAAALLAPLVKRHPEVQVKLAQMWLARGQPRRALQLLRRPIPEALADEAHRLEAQALARLGRVPEAAELLDRVEPLNGPEAALREARLWLEANQLQAARELLIEAQATFGDRPSLLYDYALILERLGERESSEGYLRKLAAMKPIDPNTLNALGYLLADTNRDLKEAERLITLARALKPADGFIMDSEGWLRFRQGDLAAAQRLIEAAWRRSPDPEIGAHLVAVYEAMGDAERAARWRAILKRRFPDR